jgi:tRNA-modifying protein YgfZ
MIAGPSFLGEYEALTRGVGVAELPGRTILAVTGSDREQILQSFTTNDVKKLSVGSGCEAFVTSTQGKTLGHVLIFCETDQHVIDTTPEQASTLIAHFDRYVITEDVQFSDRTAQLCDLLVAGLKAATVLKTLSGVDPPVQLLAHSPATLADREVTIRRVEFAGPMSYFVQVAAADAAAIAASLCTAGAILCGPEVVESARLEAGIPLFGLDITPDHLPQEVARDARAISFTKGCYLGQETVARIDALGHVNRLLVGLKFAGQDVPTGGMELLAGEHHVGHVTSAAWSPRLEAPLAMAYVRRNCARKGMMLSSLAGQAEVVVLPLGSP